MDIYREFPGPNAGYVLELYDRFQRDPGSVDSATRALFEGWMPIVEVEGPAGAPGTAQGFPVEKIAGAIDGYTISGTIHLVTNNQLGFTTPLSQERSTLYASDLARASIFLSFMSTPMTLKRASRRRAWRSHIGGNSERTSLST